MARNNSVEVPGGESPADNIDESDVQAVDPQSVTFSVATATKEQMLEHFSGYQNSDGESIILNADFSSLVELALKPQHIEIPAPAVTDGKAAYSAPVLTDKGWVV
ncbi:hypothetical protein ELP00_14685 [Salmonella enterica subsp. enterica serovar Kiambu]|nr:hypothetical protein [Salmonella enterica subsp. enterica serovar Kiambu]